MNWTKLTFQSLDLNLSRTYLVASFKKFMENLMIFSLSCLSWLDKQAASYERWSEWVSVATVQYFHQSSQLLLIKFEFIYSIVDPLCLLELGLKVVEKNMDWLC